MPQKTPPVSEDSLFKKSAEILTNFSWEIPSFLLTDEIRQWGVRYLEDVKGEKYGRELSESEEDYEWSRWLRSQAMLPNLNSFNQLCTQCHEFVDGLSKIGKQSILGTRAGLKNALIHERPSSGVEFKPELPPHQSPLSCHEYESSLGGPHVFGARLLWWCAAGNSPEKFGYAPGFSQNIWSQPFWFIQNGDYERRVNPRPLSLLKASVAYCTENNPDSKSSTDESTEGIISVPEKSDKKRVVSIESENQTKRGPGPACRFYWNGKPIELQPLQAHLMELLWTKQPNATFPVEEVAEKVWRKDTISDSACWSCISKLNRKFTEAAVPIEVYYQKGHFFFLIHQ